MAVLGSRFIASTRRANSVESAREQLHEIREEMANASHHAYAFRVGYGDSVTEGKGDDGEPRGTAGAPILAVLRGSDLGDILIVVTRYFGGRKLGRGGLVRAYGGAANDLLAIIAVEERIERSQLILAVPYPFLERVRRLLATYGVEELACDYGEQARMRVRMATSVVVDFRAAVTELSAARVVFDSEQLE